jgi:BASS family bile acid:Na+ symporter
MVGFLVFAVALDLTWEQLRRVLKIPKAPVIGLVAQFGPFGGLSRTAIF